MFWASFAPSSRIIANFSSKNRIGIHFTAIGALSTDLQGILAITSTRTSFGHPRRPVL